MPIAESMPVDKRLPELRNIWDSVTLGLKLRNRRPALIKGAILCIEAYSLGSSGALMVSLHPSEPPLARQPREPREPVLVVNRG